MSSQKRARTFKVLSALLSYPSEELNAATEELRQVLRSEGLITGGQLKRVEAFLDEFRDRDLYDLQERYTLLFDRTRSLSLHLFEHVLGESRDRGQDDLNVHTGRANRCPMPLVGQPPAVRHVAI